MLQISGILVEQEIAIFGSAIKIEKVQNSKRLYQIIKTAIIHEMCEKNPAYNILLDQKFYTKNPIFVQTSYYNGVVYADIKIDTDLLRNPTILMNSAEGSKNLEIVEAFFASRLKKTTVKISDSFLKGKGLNVELSRKQTFIIIQDLIEAINKIDVKGEDIAIISKGKNQTISIENNYKLTKSTSGLDASEVKYMFALPEDEVGFTSKENSEEASKETGFANKVAA